MKIVHTADVHLSSDHPERIEALEEVLEVCRQEGADLLLITGDLFDQNVNVEDIKTDLRPKFSDNDFHTLLIPGNHDNSAFRQEDYFGDDVEVLDERPYQKKVFDKVNIVALPYTDKKFSKLIEPLSEAREENKKNVLMIHCTLAGASGGFGNESKYMPVEPAELVQTGYDHVLSGHIHSSATRKSYENTVFAYSGSPVSISSSETGKREVWILDTEKDSMETRELETFHYLRKDLELLPGEEESALEKLEETLDGRDLDQASVIVDVEGFTERDIQGFEKEVEATVDDHSPRETEVRIKGLESSKSIVNSDIYTEFREKLDEKDFENPKLVEKKFLRGLSRHER